MENKFETEEDVLSQVNMAEEKEPRDEEQESEVEDASFEEEEDMDAEELDEDDFDEKMPAAGDDQEAEGDDN